MFPGPRCEGCGSRDACALAGTLRPEYPRCRSPLRGVDLGRMAALFEWLGRASSAHGAGAGPASALERAVIDRFRRDRLVYSDVLEHSFSCERGGGYVYRYSYAFPGHQRDPQGVAATVLAFCRPFGAPAEQACRAVLRAAQARAVTQVIFGFAHDGDSYRVKLYLQFHANESPAARDLTAKILSRPLPETDAPLHLLCLDLGAHGLTGAKVYHVIDRLRVDDPPAFLGPVALLDGLRDLGAVELRDVLFIHRIAGRGEAWTSRPQELDFSMPDNELRWSDVSALPPVRALLAESPAVTELQERFRLAMRRLSVSVGEAQKLNVYYVLAELGRDAPRD